ncbi:translation initiation factor 5A precursor (eIF-5A) [Ignisphaera aggregans DSM 17230]|uniref:Translation initiation factor 5A n=1 Tax=Ignisphaera aggregans (strain DSM 17230 / JCM 13409 / AQ1.S1) TaxID=583356 RepID=E0SNQ6_IGNAA|nr:translation initiation factor 5A precursor (eIF-5A) [Ignisphaera aggregans DSM 17230]
MAIEYGELGELKEGSYVVIDNEPCRVVEVSRAKTGKHGSAKVHITAIGLFTKSRKTLTGPADQRVEIPIIDKKVAQVVAVLGDKVQLMDLENYETFEVDMPDDESIRSKITPGAEVEYWSVLGRRFIYRVR